MKYPAGTVFFVRGVNGKTRYWKITGEHKIHESMSYSVIRCSKTGKEFKDKNGYDQRWIDENLENPRQPQGSVNCYGLVSLGGPVGVKADIEGGIETGKRKRRIQWLKATIEQFQEELRVLEESI